MNMSYYVVKYSGPFGFIKPWTAVRDGETFSQQFLTQSILEGIEKKLFPELLTQNGTQGYIIGHRLNYTGISRQQEQTWSKAWIEKKGEPTIEQRVVKKKGVEEIKEVKVPTITRRPATGILTRGVLIEPNLYLAFANRQYAEKALVQHICLCRNEDLLFPEELTEATEDEWKSEAYPGFELDLNAETSRQFKVGYNRLNNTLPMYGELKSYGDPIRKRADYL
jgi:hypothetical protein